MSFKVVHSLTTSQVDDLMVLYQHTYWAQERKREDVERMLRSTDFLFGVIAEGTGRLCAFTRVLSDGVYRAVVFDVVVHPEFRGQGLVRIIFDAMAYHPVLGKVENVLLYCKNDVSGLYERLGFSDDLRDMHLMRRKSLPDR